MKTDFSLNAKAYFELIYKDAVKPSYTYLVPQDILQKLDNVFSTQTISKPEKQYHHSLYVVDTIARDFVKKHKSHEYNNASVSYKGCQIHSVIIRRILGVEQTKPLFSFLINNGIIRKLSGYEPGVHATRFGLCTTTNSYREVVSKPEYERISQAIAFNHKKVHVEGEDLKLYLSFLKGIHLAGNWKEVYRSLMLQEYPHLYQEHTFSYSEPRSPLLKSLQAIERGSWFCYRPDPESRVYTNLTNLKREFRQLLRFQGQELIELDVKNCQPLLMVKPVKDWCMQALKYVPKDVIQHQRDCEGVGFYEYFMELNGIPQEGRTDFKIQMFAEVVYSEENSRRTPLKKQFIERSPNCHAAMVAIKGGYKSKTYNRLAIELQRLEARVIFDLVNIPLIRKGVPCFNIFDSILCLPEHEHVVREAMIKAFDTLRLSPRIEKKKIDE